MRGTGEGAGGRAVATRGAVVGGGATVVVVLDDELTTGGGAGASVTGGVVAGGGITTCRTAAVVAARPGLPSDRVATTARAEAATTVTRAPTRPVFTRPRLPSAAGGLIVSGSTAATVWQSEPDLVFSVTTAVSEPIAPMILSRSTACRFRPSMSATPWAT